MSEIVDELARVQSAYDQPTLKLLNQRTAPVVLAVFRSVFGRDVRTVPAARLHDQVNAYLHDLRLAGADDLPTGDGRDLCLRWMRGQWLIRSVDAEGDETYSLTSHAQDALALVRSLTRDRARLSEHRISTILTTVRRFNTDANPHAGARVTLLNTEIARLQAERDRIVEGGDLPEMSVDYMREGYNEVQQLVSGLPSEFARVEEAFDTMRSEVLAAFRAEERPAGEVVAEYLDRVDTLMTATPEGRAFSGAVSLLRDETLLRQLRADLAELLDHPRAHELLTAGDRTDLLGTVALIRSGLDAVIAQRKRVSATLRDYIENHDAARDRELDAVLRHLEGELTTWMETAGPRAVVDVPLLPPRAVVRHLRERFPDPAASLAPPPLDESTTTPEEDVRLDDLLAQGGPSTDRLEQALEGWLDEDPDRRRSLGDLFASLSLDLRRPVEVFGLLQLATSRGMTAADDTEPWATTRPDGSARVLAVPRVGAAPDPTTEETR